MIDFQNNVGLQSCPDGRVATYKCVAQPLEGVRQQLRVKSFVAVQLGRFHVPSQQANSRNWILRTNKKLRLIPSSAHFVAL